MLISLSVRHRITVYINLEKKGYINAYNNTSKGGRCGQIEVISSLLESIQSIFILNNEDFLYTFKFYLRKIITNFTLLNAHFDNLSDVNGT